MSDDFIRVAAQGIVSLPDNTVTNAKIVDNAVTTNKVADSAVTSAKIADGTIVNADINASAAIDVSKLSGVVASAGVGNLLTANQASIETDTTGLGKTFNSAIARTTSTALVGSASLAVTCTGAGAWTAGGDTASVSNQVAVTPGQVYTGVIYTKAAATPRAMYANLRFATGANAQVGSPVSGTAVTNSTSGWTAYYVTAVAPATAAYVQVYMVSDVTPAANEIHYLDCLGLWQGAGGLWALPGTPIANLGFYTDESVGRRIFTWDTVNNRWQMTFGSTGIRALTTWNAAGVVTGTALPAGWGPVSGEAGCIHIERNASRVTAYIQMLQATSTDPTPIPLPTGFSGSSVLPQFLVPMVPGTGAQVPRTWQNSGGLGRGARTLLTANDWVYSAELTWQTTDAWPSSLPGTAVGSIPQ